MDELKAQWDAILATHATVIADPALTRYAVVVLAVALLAGFVLGFALRAFISARRRRAARMRARW